MNVLLLSLALAAQSAPLFDEAAARGSPRTLSFELGGEGGVNDPAYAGHGLVRLRYQDGLLLPGLWLGVDYNTDSVEASLADPRALGGAAYAKVLARAQGFAANMLFDHARNGVQVPERSFGSAYLLLTGLVARDLARRRGARVNLLGDLSARQWLHYIRGETSPGLRLPPPTTALELGGQLLLEGAQPAGPFRRREGAYAFARGELIARLGQSAWGALEDAEGVLRDDGRNAVDDPLALRGQARSGLGVRGPALGPARPIFLVEGVAAGGVGLDDRYRFLLGGENPWVESVAGLGWAELLADRYGKVHLEAGAELGRWALLLLGGDLAMTVDPRRAGAFDELGTVVGAFAELQSRPLDEVWVRVKAAQAYGAPGRNDGGPGASGFKLLVHLEWRPVS